MRTFFFTLLATLCPALLSAQPWQSSKRYSAATGSTLTNTSVATAPDGSIFVTGTIRGTFMFDGISAVTPDGVTQSYLLKINPDAQAVWVQLFEQKAYCVTTDPQGNAFVGGAITNSATNGDSLTYVAKYSTSGQLLAEFESSGTGQSWAKVLRTDSNGNCYVAGTIVGAVTFGNYAVPPVGGQDGYLTKLSSNLVQVEWAVSTGSTSNRDQVFDLEVDNNGNVYTSGNYAQTYSGFPFGCYCWSGSFFTEKRSATNGLLFWQKIFSGGSGSSTAQFLALDPTGQSVFASASFKETTTFAPGISLTADNNDNYHIFATQLSASDGNVQWAKKIALTGDSYPQGMVWADSSLYLHGRFVTTMLIGTTVLTPQSNDPFVAQVSPKDGTVQSAEAFTGTNSDIGIGIDARGNRLVISGNASSQTLTIGNDALPGTSNSIYVSQKIFVPQGAAPVADFTADKFVVCTGDTVHFTNLTANGSSFVWSFSGATPATSTGTNPSVVYTAPGTYAVALTANNPFGNDNETKEEFIFVIAPPAAGFEINSSGLTVTIADNSQNANTYEWDFGDGQTLSTTADTIEHTYAAAGTYTVRLTVQNECGASVLEKMVEVGVVSTAAPEWLETLRLFPNPNNGSFTLEMEGNAAGEVEFALFGPDGRLHRTETVDFGSGLMRHSFQYEDLPSQGLHLLRIRTGRKQTFVKVVVQH